MDTTDAHGSGGPTATEHAELSRLRRENALLRTEKSVLLRVATGFAIDANALPGGTDPEDPARGELPGLRGGDRDRGELDREPRAVR